MQYKTDLQKVMEANPQWEYAFCCGYLQGKAEALRKVTPEKSLWNSSDLYAYGYRTAYNSYFQGGTAKHRTFLYHMYQE